MHRPRTIVHTAKVSQELGNLYAGISAREEVYYEAVNWFRELEKRLQSDPIDESLGNLRMGIDKPNRRILRHAIYPKQTTTAYSIEVSFDVSDDGDSVEILEILFAELTGQ